jgi:hypothetical protein
MIKKISTLNILLPCVTVIMFLMACSLTPALGSYVVSSMPFDVSPSAYNFFSNVYTGSATYEAEYFTFTPSFNGSTLYSVDLTICKVGSPVAFMHGALWSTTGIYGSTMVPLASLNDCNNSQDIQASTISTSRTLVTFNFPNNYALVAGTYYAFVLTCVNKTTFDGSNNWQFYYSTMTAGIYPNTYYGNIGYRTSGAWVYGTAGYVEAGYNINGVGGSVASYSGTTTNVYNDVTSVTVNDNPTNNFSPINNFDPTNNFNPDNTITAVVNGTVVTAVINGTVTAGDVYAGNVSAGDVYTLGGSEGGGGVSVHDNVDTSVILETLLLFGLVVINFILLLTNVAMLRFLFGLFTLVIAGLTVTNGAIIFSPYLQMMTIVISLVCMFLAAIKKS